MYFLNLIQICSLFLIIINDGIEYVVTISEINHIFV